MPAQAKAQTSTLKSQSTLQVLLSWKSPTRVFKKINREYITTISAILVLIGVILIFLKEWFLIAVLLALGFFYFILSTIKPEETEHQITNQGVVTAGKAYSWDQLVRFWFEQKDDQKMLFIDAIDRINLRLMMLLSDKGEEQIRKVLTSYLIEEKPENTWVDKAGEWVSRQVPLDKS